MLVPYACFSSFQSFSDNKRIKMIWEIPTPRKFTEVWGTLETPTNRPPLLSDVLELWKADCVSVGGTVKANEGQKKSWWLWGGDIKGIWEPATQNRACNITQKGATISKHTILCRAIHIHFQASPPFHYGIAVCQSGHMLPCFEHLLFWKQYGIKWSLITLCSYDTLII